jgi:dipeptidyl aminopeptidase/acylaminoacyl peptidase
MALDALMKRTILLFLLIFSSCGPGDEALTAHPPGSNSSVAIHTVTPGLPTAGAPTATAVPATPEPYEQYSIDSLRSRPYGDGTIAVTETLEENDGFTRYGIHYLSDGLNIYGFANVPKGEGPFPVIVVIHGLVDSAAYETLDYTTPAADGLTKAGYIVFHPDLRGYMPSDNGDDLFRVGMAVDVLNLIALIKAKSGPPELFANALAENIGLWGHSLGGNIALRLLTVTSEVKATVLYASMSGDEIKNAELLSSISSDPLLQTELSVNAATIERISPVYYYEDITSPIQLHHGTADQTVPVAWAQETCDALTIARVQVECIYYPDEDHTFRSRVIDQFEASVLQFYASNLAP